MYRFHLLGLVHLPAHKQYSSCAFTQKNRKLAKMLTSLGHEVFYYGSNGTDLKEYCNSDKLHLIETHTVQDIAKQWGSGDNRFELGYDWTNEDFRHDLSSQRSDLTLKYYIRCIEEINKRKKPDDFILATQGLYHKPITDAVDLFLKCESGIGYRGTSNDMFRCFESSYIQNFTYGSENPYGSINGNYYDRVIPNYFDPDDYEFSEKKEDYFLFIGRLIKRKGILTAYLATKEANEKLIIAGQGGFIREDGRLEDDHPKEFEIPKGNWEYVGFADVEKRKKLMSKAKAVFVPTEYLEAFGGVNVEARLSGTPVITTNFGCFPEYVENGIDGFRCDTLQDFVNATQLVQFLEPKRIRQRAERFLMDNVKWEYQKYFNDLMQLYKSATIEGEKGWHYVKRS